MEKIIYLDNTATTFVDDEVIKIVNENLECSYNPSSVYMPAVEVKGKLEKARKSLLKMLGASSGNLIFTGSATEADNMALLKIKKRDNFVALVGATEHPAVFEMAEKLKRDGAKIEYVPVDEFGKINEAEYIKLLNSYPVKFVSIMHVNNENGMINDIAKLCAIAKEKDSQILFHSDGVQAFGKIDVNVEELNVDLYTICSHKINGPKGIGALYVKKGVTVEPLIVGGGQEFSLRSGTENVPYIMGFEKAAELKRKKLDVSFEKVKENKQLFLNELKYQNVEFELFSNDECVPHILQIRFVGVRGEVLLHALEKYKIYISTGSACSSKKKTNRILEAMGKSFNQIQEVVRISFDDKDYNIFYIVDCFCKEIKKLRK